MMFLCDQPLYSNRLAAVQKGISAAIALAGPKGAAVSLLAVSKRHTAEAIKALHALGVNDFGESFAREGADKRQQLADCGLVWHFIGPLQSNKTGLVARHFDWIQSLDRSAIARRLNRQRPADMAPLDALIQVNIDSEPQKAGVSPQAIWPLAELVADLPALRLRGLMAIPRVGKPDAAQRQSFHAMRILFEKLQSRHDGIDTLSMGMSDDMDNAIIEGSTMVRIGTSLFGPRQA